MTSAKFQPIWRKNVNKIGYFDGTRINPRNITQRNTTLRIHKNHICGLIWESDGISFDNAINEIQDNFKVVDKIISDKHVKGFIEYEYEPKKVQSQLNNMIVSDIETINIDRAVLYANCIYRLNKSSGKYNRDITEQNMKNVEKIVLFLKG